MIIRNCFLVTCFHLHDKQQRSTGKFFKDLFCIEDISGKGGRKINPDSQMRLKNGLGKKNA